MKVGSLVECVKGAPGILEKGAIYTVADITKQGNLLLYEVVPPFPFTCFDKERFKEIQDPEDGDLIINEFNETQILVGNEI